MQRSCVCLGSHALPYRSDLIDVLMQRRKDKKAAKHFFRKMLKHQGAAPNRITTDKLHSYGAAKGEVMPSVVHCQNRYANPWAEVSHPQTREQERQMRRFKSLEHAQRFLAVHGAVKCFAFMKKRNCFSNLKSTTNRFASLSRA